jgi:glutathione S-transferase
MKLFFSPASPFVRKCLVVAHELGLAERIERLDCAANPVTRDPSIVARNPLGKVPTLLTDEGLALYDSRVICEYLDTLGGGGLFPVPGPARWRALTEQALGDGMLDAAVLMRYEGAMRPEPLRWAAWTAGQTEKVHSGLAEMEAHAAGWGDTLDIGKITFACALGYIDLRFASIDWRAAYPVTAAWFARFDARASMRATAPRG